MALWEYKFVGTMKTSASLFPIVELENKRRSLMASTHLMLKLVRSNGVTLLAMRCKYNKKKVLCFKKPENTGST